jgi:hypothetical protein
MRQVDAEGACTVRPRVWARGDLPVGVVRAQERGVGEAAPGEGGVKTRDSAAFAAAAAREVLESAIWHCLTAGLPDGGARVDAALAAADAYAAASCGEMLNREGSAERQAGRRARLAAEVREAYGHLAAVTRPERGRAAA